jgi:hypothetical protein
MRSLPGFGAFALPLALLAAAVGPGGLPTGTGSNQRAGAAVSSIQHVVIVYEENHSFDNILGRLCVEVRLGQIVRPGAGAGCDGHARGTTSTGKVLSLKLTPDVSPRVLHNVASQAAGIHGGAMDGFDRIDGCGKGTSPPYACYSQYDPLRRTVSPIANIASLAERYTISDRTFELRNTPSWYGHLVLANPSLGGFQGDNPHPATHTAGPGWGCDSFKDAAWSDGTSRYSLVPSCIPDQSGAGPYRASPVPYAPTIFDRLDAAGKSWRLYEGDGATGGDNWSWAICPSFYTCLSTQRDHLVPEQTIFDDAEAGTLPAFSIVTPTWADSTHNEASTAVGDTFIGSVVHAVQADPVDAPSTAIFITWDDCGCFYDHVPPPRQGWGVRVPMIIVSPYAKIGYTDHNNATYASLLAFTEHTFGLAPLGTQDANAYDYRDSFDLTATPVSAIRAPTPVMIRHRIPRAERRYLRRHPGDLNDPT